MEGAGPAAPPPNSVRRVREEGDAKRPQRASGVEVLTADTTNMKRILLLILCTYTTTQLLAIIISIYHPTRN